MDKDSTTYSGKYVEYENITYTLVPEQQTNCCIGCSLEGDRMCPELIRQHCSKGFILKEIKI